MVRADVSLSYKLLRYINSATFSRRIEVGSTRQALRLLGEREFKKWVALFALVGAAGDKPEELLVQSLVRAKFCESLAWAAGRGEFSDDLFLTGMLSLIDAMLDRPLASILPELALRPEIRAALMREGATGLASAAYECVLCYERGEWPRLREHAAHAGVPEESLPRLYLEAVEWVERHFRCA